MVAHRLSLSLSLCLCLSVFQISNLRAGRNKRTPSSNRLPEWTYINTYIQYSYLCTYMNRHVKKVMPEDLVMQNQANGIERTDTDISLYRDALAFNNIRISVSLPFLYLLHICIHISSRHLSRSLSLPLA